MPHDVRQWPATVYPGEMQKECPEAEANIDVLVRELARRGPSPGGYDVKTLGKEKGGLWQIKLKVQKRQIRILYAPYRETIVLFRIHKKGSPQEQQRAYSLAMKRKREYETSKKSATKITT
jgi:Phage derived protein Gp49-like (DUF891)